MKTKNKKPDETRKQKRSKTKEPRSRKIEEKVQKTQATKSSKKRKRIKWAKNKNQITLRLYLFAFLLLQAMLKTGGRSQRQERQRSAPRRNPPQVWSESLKNRDFHDFHNFHKIWSLMRRPCHFKISRHREATDMRLAPVDSLYIKVSAKNMRSRNKLSDF